MIVDPHWEHLTFGLWHLAITFDAISVEFWKAAGDLIEGIEIIIMIMDRRWKESASHRCCSTIDLVWLSTFISELRDPDYARKIIITIDKILFIFDHAAGTKKTLLALQAITALSNVFVFSLNLITFRADVYRINSFILNRTIGLWVGLRFLALLF